MGSFDPVSMAIATGVQAVQMGQQQRGQQSAMNQQVAAANQAAADRYERDARKRRSLLDREMASARARLGAMGVAGSGGSAAAILEGLQQRSDEDTAELHADLKRQTKQPRSGSGGGASPNAAQLGLHVLRPFIG